MTGRFGGAGPLLHGGAEPLVGEIVGLRTFRVDECGRLLPLYSPGVWQDGPNSAVCSPPAGHHHRPPHAAPAQECECGFYAYGSARSARRNRQMRFVQAVVSCWGGVVAGTHGVRAEHARVDAIWLSGSAPAWLRKRVASRYGSAQLYASREEMLAAHPLSQLPCYTRDERRFRGATVGSGLVVAVVGALVAVLGLLPLDVLHRHPLLYGSWLVLTTAAAALAVWFLLGTRGAGHVTAALLVGGFVCWLIAPLFGWPGWLLRVPLLRGAVVSAATAALSLRPGFFPVVSSDSDRIRGRARL